MNDKHAYLILGIPGLGWQYAFRSGDRGGCLSLNAVKEVRPGEFRARLKLRTH